MYIRNFGDDDDEDLNNLRELSNRLSKLSGRVLPVWALNVEDVWDLGKWDWDLHIEQNTMFSSVYVKI